MTVTTNDRINYVGGALLVDNALSPFPAPDDDDVEGWKFIHQTILTTFQSTATEVFDAKGEVPARFFLLSLIGDRIGTHIVTPHGLTKDDTAIVVRRLARTMHAFANYFSSEAWMVIAPEGKPMMDVYNGIDSLEQHPQRTESIFITLESTRANPLFTYAAIERPKKGKPKLGEWKTMPPGMDYAGRFANIISDAKPAAEA